MMRKRYAMEAVPVMRLVVVLQHEHAYWFKINDGIIAERYVETLARTLHEDVVRCPWTHGVDGAPQRVELILDSTLDEVNRIGVRQSNNKLINRYRQWRTLGRARRDFPHARVYPLPEAYQEQVAAIMHSIIPEQWEPWLLALQSHSVVFHCASTGNEIIERWSRQFGGKVLVLMSTDKNQRHLLIERGATVFLRSVPVPVPVPVPKLESESDYLSVDACGERSDKDSLDAQALLHGVKHLFEHELSRNSAVRFIRPIGNAEWVAASREIQSAKCNASVECLVEMHLGVSVAYRIDEWRDNRLEMLEPQEILRSSNKTAFAKLFNRFNRFNRFDRFSCLKKSVDFWLCSRSTLRRFSVLAPSFNYQGYVLRRAAVHQFSMVFAGVACLAAVSSIANGVKNRSVAKSLEVQRMAAVDSRLIALDSAEQLFDDPWFVATSLSLSDQLMPPRHALAESLLDGVATALMVVPDVSLDRLVWIRIEDDEVYESLSHALGGVSHRQSVEDASNKVDMQLEISGQISGNRLAHQKSLLDEFMGQLLRLNNVVDISLLESPVDTALSSDYGVHSAGRYRVSVSIGGGS